MSSFVWDWFKIKVAGCRVPRQGLLEQACYYLASSPSANCIIQPADQDTVKYDSTAAHLQSHLCSGRVNGQRVSFRWLDVCDHQVGSLLQGWLRLPVLAVLSTAGTLWAWRRGRDICRRKYWYWTLA